MASRWLTVAAGLLVSSPLLLEAQTASGLTCTVQGRTVYLDWNPTLLALVSQNLTIIRDGVPINTRVPPDLLSYNDGAPRLGQFQYQVQAVLGNGSSFS